jgi:RNA polymerase sigma-70 factor, ECF subfamily
MTSQKSITRLLKEGSRGDKGALDELLPLVYQELRRLAEAYMSRERDNHTLQPTALVHEAYLRLIDQKSVDWQNRAQFFGLAAQMMRRILITHAQTRRRLKRGGPEERLSLDEAVSFFTERDVDLAALDEALSRLESFDPQQGRMVELRFFGGLSVEETAAVMGISPATVKREWATAKLWLKRELSQQNPP